MNTKHWSISGASDDGSHVDIKYECEQGYPHAITLGLTVRQAEQIVAEHNRTQAALHAQIEQLVVDWERIKDACTRRDTQIEQLRHALSEIAAWVRVAMQREVPPKSCGNAAPGIEGLTCILGPGHKALHYSRERYSWPVVQTEEETTHA